MDKRAAGHAGASGPTGPSRAARMTRVQWLLGLGAIALGLLLHGAGVWERAEFAAFDFKSKFFCASAPGLSDRVVVAAIDDPTLETVLGWPMNRELLGRALLELERAGASVLAVDLLFDSPGQGGPAADASLAKAMGERRRTVLAANFVAKEGEAVRAEGTSRPVRFAEVLAGVQAEPGIEERALRLRVLPGSLDSGPEAEAFRRAFAAAKAVNEIIPANTVTAPDAAAGLHWPRAVGMSPPLPELTQAAGRLATVNFGGGDSDGSVRRLPLWVEFQGRLYPAMGLHAAFLHLGTRVESILMKPGATIVPRGNGALIAIPTHRRALREPGADTDVDGLAAITWPRGGFDGWRSQFSLDGAPAPNNEAIFSLGRVLDPIVTLAPAIQRNIAALDTAFTETGRRLGVMRDVDAYAAAAHKLAGLSPLDDGWREIYSSQLAAWKAAETEAAGFAARAVEGVDRSKLTAEERRDLEDLESLATGTGVTIREIEAGTERLRNWREEALPALVKGKICFIGWTSTGALADNVATSIDARTPGVMVHAAVASSILKQAERRTILTPAPVWIGALALVLLGVLAAGIAVTTPVGLSPLALLAAAAAWSLVDGALVFDRARLVLPIAAPLITMGGAWLIVMLHKLLVEQRGRRQTEARFRQYVSPDVVDILVNNPQLSSMEPQRRELSIIFSDIRGFTTLAERLGTEGTFTLLSRYLGAMTDVLQGTRATLDKYLGDGIMAFWGAPLADPDHALHAAQAALRMLEELDRLNSSGAFGEAGALSIRIGLACGEVNVGDFGNPPTKSAYTVIGDSVNLAARLESANKQLGSTILMNERLRAGLPDSLRVRPLGKIIVMGKASPEVLFELVGDRSPRGPRTDDWIALTRAMVEAFQASRFDECTEAGDRLEREFNDGALVDLYRQAVAEARAAGAGAAFSGCITLREK